MRVGGIYGLREGCSLWLLTRNLDGETCHWLVSEAVGKASGSPEITKDMILMCTGADVATHRRAEFDSATFLFGGKCCRTGMLSNLVEIKDGSHDND